LSFDHGRGKLASLGAIAGGQMDRYGTVMIARLRNPADAAQMEVMADTVRQWIDEHGSVGFLREDLMLTDDGTTVVATIFFDSEDTYRALSDDPDQDTWYSERLAPLLDGAPQWLDGHWTHSFDVAR
jgi:hypothetical protein